MRKEGDDCRCAMFADIGRFRALISTIEERSKGLKARSDAL